MKYHKIKGQTKPYILKMRISEKEQNDLMRQAFNNNCSIAEVVRQRLFKNEQVVKVKKVEGTKL
jgi:hypothetical protein